jgi:four helix bundle protein
VATFQSFEEIAAWQKARELAREIYTVSNRGGFSKDFGLRDQIRRASVSSMSNIVEGFERSGNGEFTQFLAIAKGSAGEVRAQLYVAADQSYIDSETFRQLCRLATETSRMISGLMNYLRTTQLKGTKYK